MLIGRDPELERIRRALAVAREGGSDVLVLRGQPGIGKTALLQEEIALGDGMTVLRVRGLEAEAEQPYSGLAALCRPVVELRDRLPAAQAGALASALELSRRPRTRGWRSGPRCSGCSGSPPRSSRCSSRWTTCSGSTSRRWKRCGSRPRLGDGGVAMLPAQQPVREAGDGLRGPGGRAARRRRGARAAPGRARAAAAGGGRAQPRRDRGRQSAGAREIPALLPPDVLEGRAPIAWPLPPGSTLEKRSPAGSTGSPAPTRQALLVAAAAEVRRGDVVLAALAAAGLDLAALERAEEAGVVALTPRGRVRAPVAAGRGVPRGRKSVGRRAAHRAVASALSEGARSARGSSRRRPLPHQAVAAALEQAAQAARVPASPSLRTQTCARRSSRPTPSNSATARRGRPRSAARRASGGRARAARAGRPRARDRAGRQRRRHGRRAAHAARAARAADRPTAEARDLLRAQARGSRARFR